MTQLSVLCPVSPPSVLIFNKVFNLDETFKAEPKLLFGKTYITLFMTSPPLYMSLHTLYLWHHSHCNYDKTPAIFLTWYSVYMRSHPLNEWQHNDGFWHDTQCICVIKPTWLMTSQPMYVWNHTHCMHDTIGTLHDITSTLADNIILFICHGTNSVYDIICILCDITTTFTDIKRLYSWHHIHNIPEYRTECIRHNIHYTCDITAIVTMTRHLQCF